MHSILGIDKNQFPRTASEAKRFAAAQNRESAARRAREEREHATKMAKMQADLQRMKANESTEPSTSTDQTTCPSCGHTFTPESTTEQQAKAVSPGAASWWKQRRAQR